MGNTAAEQVRARGSPVHPHTHGEHRVDLIQPFADLGSSPHAWGTQKRHPAPHLDGRFIPTRMGNTSVTDRASSMAAVHPHTHGEHMIRRPCFSASCGSSPHAWGTRKRGLSSTGSYRFIPTRMGNTPGRIPQSGRLSVHPHTHGEHISGAVVGRRPAGSSPHAWGTPVLRERRRPDARFIPTRMGNTPLW